MLDFELITFIVMKQTSTISCHMLEYYTVIYFYPCDFVSVSAINEFLVAAATFIIPGLTPLHSKQEAVANRFTASSKQLLHFHFSFISSFLLCFLVDHVFRLTAGTNSSL